MVVLQDDLTSWGELVFRERRLVHQVSDFVLWDVMACADASCKEEWASWRLASSSWRMENVVHGVRRSVIDFHYMNVCMVRRRKKERIGREPYLFFVVFLTNFVVLSLILSLLANRISHPSWRSKDYNQTQIRKVQVQMGMYAFDDP
jgi:hypothetical protein